MLTGMNKATGRALTGIEHLRQSINDIILTPIGSVVMNRDYGSFIPELIDHPTNSANLLRLQSATVMALNKWEPRLTVNRVGITMGEAPGEMNLDLEGSQTDASGRTSPLTLNVPLGGLR